MLDRLPVDLRLQLEGLPSDAMRREAAAMLGERLEHLRRLQVGWGEVIEVTPLGRHHAVRVRWPDGTERRVLSVNLQRKHAPERAGIDFDPDTHAPARARRPIHPNPNQRTTRRR